MISQKESVYQAFVAHSNGASLADCLQDSSFRNKVKETVASGLASGDVEWNCSDKTAESCLSYASQLVANWFKRDTRISGVKYAPLTQRGPQVKDEKLSKLITASKSAAVHAPEKLPQIEAMITARKAELAAEKSKTKVMSVTDLTATLAELGIEL